MERFLLNKLSSATMRILRITPIQHQGIILLYNDQYLYFYRSKDLDILRRLRSYMEENVETME